MKTNFYTNQKRRPFKVWVRNKRYNINLRNSFTYTPKSFFPSYAIPFSFSFKTYQRPRRVVVRALKYAYVSSNSIEAFRKCLAPYFRKKKITSSKLLIRLYSYIPLTKKPAEVRMGGGKGAKIRGFFSPVRPGQIIFEVLARNPKSTYSILTYASRKLSLPVKISYI